MKCFNCDNEIPKGAKFCGICGKRTFADRELIDRALSGDETAQNELYKRAYSEIYWTVLGMVRDEQGTWDVMQDAYLSIFRKLDTLKTPETYTAWAKQIAANRATDWLRKNRREILFSEMEQDGEGDDVELAFEDGNEDNMPESVIDRNETARLVREILDELDDKYRVPVMMAYMDGMKQREIAETLGLSENTVKTRIRRGQQQIKEKVLQLEKRGTKLYSLAPFAFFLWLLKNLETDDAGRSHMQGVYEATKPAMHASNPASRASTDAAGKAAETAKSGATEAGKGAAATAAHGAGTKIVIGIIIAAVGASIAGGIIHKQLTGNDTKNGTETDIETDSEPETDEETSTSAEKETVMSDGEKAWRTAYADFLETSDLDDAADETGENSYYLVYVNDDDTPEIYMEGTYTAEGGALFYIENGEVKTENMGSAGVGILYAERGGFICLSFRHTGGNYDAFYGFDGETLSMAGEADAYLDYESYAPQYYWNGEEVSAEVQASYIHNCIPEEYRSGNDAEVIPDGLTEDNYADYEYYSTARGLLDMDKMSSPSDPVAVGKQAMIEWLRTGLETTETGTGAEPAGTETDNGKWKNIYLDYVTGNEFLQGMNFIPIFINDDTVPEILVKGDDLEEAIFFIQSGEIALLDVTTYDIYYNEKKEYFYTYYAEDATEYFKLYSWDGEFLYSYRDGSETSREPLDDSYSISGYTAGIDLEQWKGQNITADTKNAADEEMMTYSELIDHLQN